MLQLISMKNFEGHLGLNCGGEKFLIMSKVMWFGSHIGLNIKALKILFSRMAQQIDLKLHKLNLLALGNIGCKF